MCIRDRGEIVSIVGPSGAGKTTLLQIMGTLDMPDGGSVVLDGTQVHRMREKELSAFRNRHSGFVFQFHQMCIRDRRLTGGATIKPIKDLTLDIDVAYSSVENRYKKYGTPVSYTHLDVYKRQVCTFI